MNEGVPVPGLTRNEKVELEVRFLDRGGRLNLTETVEKKAE